MAYRVIFCGTPAFAVPALRTLVESDQFDVVLVLSQPDRPAGRGKKLQASAVKEFAQSKGLTVLTPESCKSPEFIAEMKTYKADAAVVVAYGQILSKEFLGAFAKGCVNIHGSLLPRWRGAAPIQRAIMSGDPVTGVSLQVVVFELDAGDVIGERQIKLDDEMGTKELYQKLSELGAEMLTSDFIEYLQGTKTPVPQDASKVTIAKKISKSEASIDWSWPAQQIHNQVRGLNAGGPYAMSLFREKQVKIHKTKVTNTSGTPGEIIRVDNLSLQVACGEGALEILELQPESKSKMSAGDFVRGFQIKKESALAQQFKIAPSILSADFASLGEEVKSVLAAGADWIHVDVMDGHFVPNLTIGAPVVKSLRKIKEAYLDCHLMIEEPEKYIGDFLLAGADNITLHIESQGNMSSMIEQIKSEKRNVGITLRPATPLSDIEPYLDKVDLVLVMTVNPGFGGQAFMEDQVDKIEQLFNWRNENKNYTYQIQVDGGVSDVTKRVLDHADILVAGSFIFKEKGNYKKAIDRLRDKR